MAARIENRSDSASKATAAERGGADKKGQYAVGLKRAATGMGLFSIALGIAEIAGARRIARGLGLKDDGAATTTLRAFGGREIAAGAMLLRQPAAAINMWNRVGGDLLDAAALGVATRSSRRPQAIGAAFAFVGAALVADLVLARALEVKTGKVFPVG